MEKLFNKLEKKQLKILKKYKIKRDNETIKTIEDTRQLAKLLDQRIKNKKTTIDLNK